LPCCLPYGKAGGLQILCCQGINVTDYNFNLDALALKPSDFCNVRVKSAGMKKIGIMSTPLEQKSSLEEIEKRFDNDVARFSNLATGFRPTKIAGVVSYIFWEVRRTCGI